MHVCVSIILLLSDLLLYVLVLLYSLIGQVHHKMSFIIIIIIANTFSNITFHLSVCVCVCEGGWGEGEYK